jgi:glycosyltransferase involved in cell wall biosynthesis
MRKLIIVPGPAGIGGLTVSLSMMIQGFEKCGAAEQLCVLVKSGSELEQYLQQAEQASYLHSIQADNRHQFSVKALRWAAKQPQDWPLLLENWTSSAILPALTMVTPVLRLSGRPIYHSFRDPAHSTNWMGMSARKLIFTGLSPVAICNSQFTAQNVSPLLLSEVKVILYPPVDTEKLQKRSLSPPPEPLKPILDSGSRIILTPSRLSQPEQFNDKNLRGLIPVLAKLKASGHHYHGVVIGQDYSVDRIQTQTLLEQAQHLGVADRFTVLPPTFAIQDYYHHADVVVTLAPREPFGRTVVEAIACGVPVIGSRTGGIGEILSHFAPEWAVDPHDSLAAAEAILNVAADPNTSSILAQGKSWVEEQCNVEKYARKLIKIMGLDSIGQSQEQHDSRKIAAI